MLNMADLQFGGMGRTCVFCGGTPLTREHVFPRWLAGVLPEQDQWRAQDLVVVGGESITSTDLPITTREMGQRFTDSTVARVCASCNHGWMNDLEEASRSVVTALIRGDKTSVSIEQAKSLAFWVAKTCVMAQLTHTESAATPPSDYHHMHRERTPPPAMKMWALNIDTADWGVRMHHFGILVGNQSKLEFSQPCNTYSTTIGLGHVAFCVMATTSESLPLLSLDDIPPLKAVHLWPEPSSFEWGQTGPLDDESVGIVSDLLRLWIGDDDDLFMNALMVLGLRNM